jgi:hypothetical protein
MKGTMSDRTGNPKEQLKIDYDIKHHDVIFGTDVCKMKSFKVVDVKFLKVAWMVVSCGFPNCFLKLKAVLMVALWMPLLMGTHLQVLLN